MATVTHMDITAMDIWLNSGDNRVFVTRSNTPNTRFLGSCAEARIGSAADTLDTILEPVEIMSCRHLVLTDTGSNQWHTYTNDNFGVFLRDGQVIATGVSLAQQSSEAL